MDNSLPTSLNRNKRLKEQFVSNLSGSSMTEIAALSLIAPLLFVLHHAICYHYNTDSLTKWTSSKKDDNDDAIVSSKNWRTYMTTITMDFLFSVLPMLLFFTVLAQWTFISAIMLSSLIFFIAAKRKFSSMSYSGGFLSLRSYILSYRVLMMLVTCLCILAVDFRIFPRRYAKTETYGTSLMDLGVGSFVIANSLVSWQARGVSVVNLKNTILSTGPVLLLGFVRLVSTRSVDYQVHSAEYGVHWNFFFTLAAVSVITSVINVPPHYSGILGLAILIGNWFSSLEYIFQFYLQKTLYLALLNKFDKVSSGYQYWLSHGLNAYLLSDERGTDILSKNKEGIFSILGYWGLYLVGVQLGYSLFFGNHFSRVGGNKWARIKVSFLSLTFWLATVLLDRHVERVSRRMCNLAYVTLVLAQNLQVLAVLMLSDYIAGSKISALEEAFNQNLLGSFLLANILTGLVNLCVDTLFASSLVALFVLLVYTFSLSMLTGLADFYGVRLKFW